MNNYLMDIIDRLFDENRPKEAEAFMLDELMKAKTEGQLDSQLFLLNELIGYYRQTSEKEPLRRVIDEAIELAEDMDLSGSIPYATTMINAANACRSMGELQRSREYYLIAEEIYKENIANDRLDSEDLLLAGLYNNFSLLYQELKDYKAAEEYQLKALKIVMANEAGFEIAVTYANLANTYLLAEDYDKAMVNALKAKKLFEERRLKDPHYCGALSALGNCYLHMNMIMEAKEIFTQALHIVEETFGRNSQYERLLDSLRLCMRLDDEAEITEFDDGVNGRMKTESGDDCEAIITKEEGDDMDNTDMKAIKGMELSGKFYEKFGQPMIMNCFSEYENEIAVGLVGEGSDCFGFDDDYSKDHDFGPEFCLWLTDEAYEKIGEDLAKEYEKLPKEFCGFKRQTTAMGAGRRGVIRISDFYKKYLGTDNYEEIDFKAVPDYALAACVNGAVFKDNKGMFSKMRERLMAGYPEDVRLLRLSEDVAGFSQCGQYNYLRMHKRGDDLTANIMLADFCRHAMRLYHHIMNVYPPHDKWLVKSTQQLLEGETIVRTLNRFTVLNAAGQYEAVAQSIEQLAELFAGTMYDCGVISDIDSYLDHHVGELLFKASVVMDDVDTLAEKIAKLEFKAFDKVQNEGGRASCQNNWLVFSIMRRSQYLTWDKEMLVQYYYDFTREYERGHNLITEKYGRMMESTAPDKYEAIKDSFPPLSEDKRAIIEQIVALQMKMAESFAEEYPKVAGNARNLHTYEDDMLDTSMETYLRGEISTYSDKMLQLYGGFVVRMASEGKSIARMTIENTARLYGYKSLEEFEERI